VKLQKGDEEDKKESCNNMKIKDIFFIKDITKSEKGDE